MSDGICLFFSFFLDFDSIDGERPLVFWLLQAVWPGQVEKKTTRDDKRKRERKRQRQTERFNMNDIFKIFKKRAQSGKSTNLTDVIKDLNEKEQNEIMGSDVGPFDRGNRSYLSISKSGRLKSKKSHNASRILNDDLFAPAPANSSSVAVMTTASRQVTSFDSMVDCSPSKVNEICGGEASKGGVSITRSKPLYDQYSDNADSSTSSSFRSSLEDLSSSMSLLSNEATSHHHVLQQQQTSPQASQQQCSYLLQQHQTSFPTNTTRLQVYSAQSHAHYSTTLSATKSGSSTAYSFTKVHRRV